MSNSNIETKVEELLQPIITKLQYELYDVQYAKEGKDYYLRIIIDKPNGISIEDCEKVNHEIDVILEEADLISVSYFLEVSSPGIERVLRKAWHFQKQLGKKVKIKLFQPIHQKKEWEGILKSYGEDFLELEVDEKIIEIDNKSIASAKTVEEMF